MAGLAARRARREVHDFVRVGIIGVAVDTCAQGFRLVTCAPKTNSRVRKRIVVSACGAVACLTIVECIGPNGDWDKVALVVFDVNHPWY